MLPEVDGGFGDVGSRRRRNFHKLTLIRKYSFSQCIVLYTTALKEEPSGNGSCQPLTLLFVPQPLPSPVSLHFTPETSLEELEKPGFWGGVRHFLEAGDMVVKNGKCPALILVGGEIQKARK
ncbi:hypothetical protein AAY473_007190 [Plecturocebus cupreus]